ncbi:MAG TPA: VOC family protein [Caulobacteraceae bacterium]|nr:VOC family protein [Caulobacteraceae bacterium]
MARSPDYLSAVGIGVADLDRSLDFYCRVLGMQKTQTFKLPHMEEIIVAHEGRNAVVLMHYTDGSTRNYKDNPVKLVFYVADAKARAEAIRAAGQEVTREAEAMATMGGAIIGMGKDPDGYVIELIRLATAPA